MARQAPVIQLPVLSAPQLVTLVAAMLTVAAAQAATFKKGELPGNLEPARQRLQDSLDDLQSALTLTAATDTQSQKQADNVIDNAWAAFHDWLGAWARIPGDHAADADSLSQLLFPTGLAFLRLAYKLEYVESENRLNAITPDHESFLNDLGGAPMLAHLRDAHAAYGAALGITEVKEAPATPDIGSKRQACLQALRVYVTRVMAYPDPDIDGSQELADNLNEPLTEFKPTKRKPKSVNPPAPAPTPAPTPPVPAPPTPGPATKGEDKKG